MNEDTPTPLMAISASNLVSASLIASLIGKLAEKGILSNEDTREIYGQALLSLEEQNAQADSPEYEAICEFARQIIEDQLRGQG